MLSPPIGASSSMFATHGPAWQRRSTPHARQAPRL